MADLQWREAWSVLVGAEGEQAWGPSRGGAPVWVALSADPSAVERVGEMPAEGVLSQAPLETFDVIELSVFAQPVARVNWLVDRENSVGAVGQVEAVRQGDVLDDATAAILTEAALDEAWQEGAEVVTTVVPEAQAEAWLARGWERIEAVSPLA